MPMNTTIREKRKELGLTQKQIADYLGVSTPAVNKWEAGLTYPDITLLPALARLLKTDLNTLLCYEEELSEKEIGLFMNRVTEVFRKKGFKLAFDIAMEKIREYPSSIELINSLTLVLQGCLIMTEISSEEKEFYDEQINSLYERIAESGDPKYSDNAKYMIVSRLINNEEYTKAQELLDQLPKYNALDKRNLQGSLYLKEGKIEEAAKIYEYKLLSNIQDIQIILTNLVNIAIQEGDKENGDYLAKCGKKVAEMFGLWEYSSFLVPLENAVLNEDIDETLEVLQAMISALLIPWDMKKSPICRHIQQKPTEINLGEQMIPVVLQELENSSSYDFLRHVPEFQQLLEKYRSMC